MHWRRIGCSGAKDTALVPRVSFWTVTNRMECTSAKGIVCISSNLRMCNYVKNVGADIARVPLVKIFFG